MKMTVEHVHVRAQNSISKVNKGPRVSLKHLPMPVSVI